MIQNGKKITAGILFGGKSAEHEISLQSAKNIYDAIDRSKFDPVLIGIDKTGKWFLNADARFLLNADDPRSITLAPSGEPAALIPECAGQLSGACRLPKLDVVFPVLHGPFGEDGTVQGLLKLAGVPFVGSGVTGSALGMDKDVMKKILRDAGLPVGKFLTLKRHETIPSFAEVKAVLGVAANVPLFIKPANMGSSIGINKVQDETAFFAAAAEAFQYDTKIIIEEFIQGREIECAVLGNENPAASVPGEVIPAGEFYSYEAKYLDENGAALQIPAKLDEETQNRIRELSIKVFQALCCDGLARVDFFLKEDGCIIVNEINTMPGFTKISMYPKLWEASAGAALVYTDLITRLIELAIEKHEKERTVKITR